MLLKIDDRVAYSVQFLRSVGESHGEMAHARGTLRAFEALRSLTLARIEWDERNMPERVNIHNLAKVGPNRRFCNID